jgi:lipopolysaccharide biosynthesis regulator YciM
MARFARLQPGSAVANYYYGLALSNRHHEKEAQSLFAKAISLDPRLAGAHLQIGILAARNADYPAAIHAYRDALASDPKLEEAHFRLSEAYRISGDRVKAKEELATYQRLSSESAENAERERREIQRFVVDLRGETAQ